MSSTEVVPLGLRRQPPLGLEFDIGDLRCFAVASGCANFPLAGRSLRLNASTVSRRVARLEDALGVTLFERGRFGIRLTDAGRGVMLKVTRALDEIDELVRIGKANGVGFEGCVRLGVRMPPIGDPMRSLLAMWHADYPDVELSLHEMNDHEIRLALTERRIDAAFVPQHTLWPDAVSIPIYEEPLFAGLPVGHHLCEREVLTWELLRKEPILTQEWTGSHCAREFFSALMGGGIQFYSHAASKQSVFALVGAEFGVTLATRSQADVRFPGVEFKPIREDNAVVKVDLTWRPDAEDPAVGRFIAFVRDKAHCWMTC